MREIKYSGLIGLLLFLAGCIFSCSENNLSLSLNGTWHVEEHSQLYGTQHYDVQITQLDSTKIEITNFYNLGTDTYVYVLLDEATITISKQVVNGYTIQGSGTVKNDFKNIIFNFTASDGTVQDVVVAHFKR